MHTKRKDKHSWKWMIAGVLILLVIAAGPVFADGEVPEEAPPEEEILPPEEADLPLEEVESVVVKETAKSKSESNSACSAPQADGGEDALEGDPWFKVGSTIYRFYEDANGCNAFPGDPNCYDGLANPIQSAVDHIDINNLLPSDRKLNIEAGDYTGNVHIQGAGSVLAQMKIVEGAGAGVTNIDGQFEVYNNTGGFELKGVSVEQITINGGAVFGGNTGTLKITDVDAHNPNGHGIDVLEHMGSVEITDVRTGGNYGSGGQISNIGSSGSVKVLNSWFNWSGQGNEAYPAYGLYIETDRAITIEGVSAKGNQGDGFNLNGFNKLTMKHIIAEGNEDTFAQNFGNFGVFAWSDMNAPVVLENIRADGNGGTGIYLQTQGSIKAKDIQANHNSVREGAIYFDNFSDHVGSVFDFLARDIDADAWQFELTSPTYLEFTLSSDQWQYGFDPMFEVYAQGNPTPVLTDDNGLDGWSAYNTATLGAGVYKVHVLRSGGGDAYGEYLLSVDDLTPSQETYIFGLGGFVSRNMQGGGSFKLENGSFYQNAQSGLDIINRNSVTVSSVTSGENGDHGVYIDKTGRDWGCTGSPSCYSGIGSVNVTSPKSTGWLTTNRFERNGGAGLFIESRGSVTTTNFDTYENLWDGLYIDNCLYDETMDTCFGTGNVTINATAPNWENGAWDNGDVGFFIDTKGNVLIEKSRVMNNPSEGIAVTAMGTIKLIEVGAEDNGSFGAMLNNLHATSPKTVTVQDGEFNNNANTGLYVETGGAIFIKGGNATQNYSPMGSWVEQMPVTYFDEIYEGDFNEYYHFELDSAQSVQIIMRSYDFDSYLRLYDGSMMLLYQDDDSYGGYNGYDAVIHQTLPAGDYTIMVDSNLGNEFGHYELSIDDENQDSARFPGSGVELFNNSTTNGITFSPTKEYPHSRYNDNGNMGIYLKSNGTIKLTNAEASGNGRSGLSTANPDSTKTVTIQDTSKYPETAYSDNRWQGIFARTGGTIKVLNIHAERNGLTGADLDNCLEDGMTNVCMGTGGITVSYKKSEHAAFADNGFRGLEVRSRGTIKLTNIYACDNASMGAKVKNRYDNSTGTVTINTSGNLWNHFNNNGWGGDIGEFEAGLTVSSHGNVTISNLSANENINGLGGLSVFSSTSSSSRNISVANAEFNDNENVGMALASKGNITIKDIQANMNNGVGAMLGNTAGMGNVYVKYSKGRENQFQNNNGSGLEINTNGLVTLGNVRAEDNFKLHGGFGDFGPTDTAAVHEYFNWDQGRDHWWFYASPGTYSFYMQPSSMADLDPYSFDPWLGLYDENETLIAADNDSGGYPNAYIQHTFVSSGWYYLGPNSAVAEESGFYELSANDPTFSGMEYIWVSGVQINAGKNVTVSGSQFSVFNHNSLIGLGINTPGTISVKNARANDNGTEGFYIRNTNGTGNVSITGSSVNSLTRAFYNGWQGFAIWTNGTSTLKNLLAYGNRQEGVRLGTDTEPTGKNVTLNNVGGSENGEHGVSVDTLGKITASKVSAENNGECGVYLINYYGTQPVVFNGDSYLRNNADLGLFVETFSNTTISKVNAEGNGINNIGVNVIGGGNISLSNIISRFAWDHGIFLATDGNVTLSSVISMSNGNDMTDGDGVHIEVSPMSVVTIKSSVFMGNAGNGIEVINAIPTISKTYYFGNDADGDWTPDQIDLYVH